MTVYLHDHEQETDLCGPVSSPLFPTPSAGNPELIVIEVAACTALAVGVSRFLVAQLSMDALDISRCDQRVCSSHFELGILLRSHAAQ
jgi:hypothetical protein